MNAVRRIVVERFATGKTSVVDALCSTDLAKHQCDRSGTDAQAREHVKDAIRQLHAVRPGMRFAIEGVLEDGDRIWARVRGQGAAGGLFSAHRADGRWRSPPWWTSPGHWGVPLWSARMTRTGVLDRPAPMP